MNPRLRRLIILFVVLALMKAQAGAAEAAMPISVQSRWREAARMPASNHDLTANDRTFVLRGQGAR
jgi:hypothetical protein